MKSKHTNKRILLVSDDSSAREALGEMLRAINFNVLCAENGRSAEKMLLENPVSMIVLDYRTRFDAKDSISPKARTLAALTDVDPFLPVILTCTADAELDYEAALMADLVLRHPVSAPALRDGIDTLLAESLRERVYRKSDFIATLR
jgi:two-component system sensor histidine kinase/response regulator